MDDIKAIERLLYTLKVSAEYGDSINPKMVYSNLIHLGDRVVNNPRINNSFNDWIDTFKNTDKLDVFVDYERWPYFCQFVNDDPDKINPYNMIKMYIPVDDAHINEAAKRIFNFMAQNNILHHSKIGSDVRFDDIVLRVADVESAKRIEEFVMNDPYIRDGLMKPNPFAYNNGYISYVWDGELSFNTVVASYISGYINELNKNNQLNQVSYKGLVAYIGEEYQTVFKDGKNIDDYMAKMNVNNKYQLDNYQKVTELLLHSIMPDKKKEDFFKVYNDIILNHNNKNEDLKTYISEKQKVTWNEIYAFLVKKYGYLAADQHIFMFLKTGDYTFFTRENGVRDYLINNNFTKDMVKELFLLTTKEKRIILDNASYDTYQKYGYTQIFVGLKNALSGYYKNFTNENGGRDNLKNTISSGEIRGIIIGKFLENGYDMKDIPEENDLMLQEYINQLEMRKNSKNHI